MLQTARNISFLWTVLELCSEITLIPQTVRNKAQVHNKHVFLRMADAVTSKNIYSSTGTRLFRCVLWLCVMQVSNRSSFIVLIQLAALFYKFCNLKNKSTLNWLLSWRKERRRWRYERDKQEGERDWRMTLRKKCFLFELNINKRFHFQHSNEMK